MKRKVNSVLILIIVAMLGSGCGSFTKMRYSRGFKSNIEFNRRDRTAKTEELKASKAIKKGSTRVIAKNNKAIVSPPEPMNTFSKTTETLQPKQSKIKNNPKQLNKTKTGILKIPEIVRQSKQTNTVHSGGPIEPNVLAAAILFYGALILFAIFILSLTAPAGILSFIQLILLTIMMTVICFTLAIIGVILAMVGLARISESGNLYSGKWLAISILIFAIGIILTVVLV